MLPTNLRPVTSWRDRNEAFRDIALAIHRVVEELAPHMNKTEQEQEEEGARQIIEWALEGEPLGAAILARALEEAEKSILFMSERYELQYPDQNGKLQPCTLATLPEPAATTTTLLAMTAFTLLCGDKGDKEWYFITADDILDIEEFIKHSPLYVPSQKWPFTKEQIRAA